MKKNLHEAVKALSSELEEASEDTQALLESPPFVMAEEQSSLTSRVEKMQKPTFHLIAENTIQTESQDYVIKILTEFDLDIATLEKDLMEDSRAASKQKIEAALAAVPETEVKSELSSLLHASLLPRSLGTLTTYRVLDCLSGGEPVNNRAVEKPELPMVELFFEEGKVAFDYASLLSPQFKEIEVFTLPISPEAFTQTFRVSLSAFSGKASFLKTFQFKSPAAPNPLEVTIEAEFRPLI